MHNYFRGPPKKKSLFFWSPEACNTWGPNILQEIQDIFKILENKPHAYNNDHAVVQFNIPG